MRKQRRAPWVAAILVSAVAASILGLAPPARASDDYPFRGQDSSELDPRGFYHNNCTSFVAWRLSQRGPFDNYMNGGHWYHARNWADNAQRLGFAVDSAPAVGAIAHWYPGEGGADELGHVAYVESVNADGAVFVEEYNGSNPYAYSRRGPLRAGRYIHVYDVGPSQEAPTRAPSTKNAAQPPPVAPAASAAAPTKPQTPDGVPVGRVTTPSADKRLWPGQKVAVAGTFTDDARVAKVHFFAADERYQWTLIGTDAHGGNGTYSVPWTVDYPAGSRLSVYAEAFDDAGHHAVDSIRGLEGITVGGEPGGAVTLAAGRDLRHAPVASHKDAFAGVKAMARGASVVHFAVAMTALLMLNALPAIGRRRRRARLP